MKELTLKDVAKFLKLENPESAGPEEVCQGIVAATEKGYESGCEKGEPRSPTLHATPDEYRKSVLFTESMDFEAIHTRLKDPKILRLLHGAYGMATEAAELLDATKKYVFYGKTLDEINVKEEVGDSDWYREIILDAFGWTDGEVKRANIEKLKRRYPNGFSMEDAINRDLEAERKVLEGEYDEDKSPAEEN
jgi:NTP pyrophosphatase (non-canonical NTP hydrolase)